MPNTLLHTFTVVDGFVSYHFTQLYNDDTDVVTLQDDSDYEADHGHPLTSVTEAEMGVPDGFVFRQFCRGSILVKVKAKLFLDPFAEVQYVNDDPGCAPPPPCTLEISNVTVTNETLAGAHDGTVQLESTGGVNVMYSIDGVTWQTSGFFFNLFPGSYQAYARGDTNCSSVTPFIVLAGPTIDETLYPWKERFCHFFRLLFPDGSGGWTALAIREPGKWDSINFIGKRSKEWHGYRGMFSDGIVELEFDCPAGMEELITAYEIYGSDAEVLFRFGYTYLGIEHILFPGKLNFNTYKKLTGRVSMSVEREDFNVAFESFFESKVSMAAVKSLDGTDITPPPVIDFTLHSKEIVRTYSAGTSEPILAHEAFDTDIFFFIKPDTSTPSQNEIEENFSYPLGVSNLAPYNFSEYNWKMKFGGTYNFSVSFNYDLTIYRSRRVPIPDTSTRTFTIKTFFRINDIATQMGGTLVGELSEGNSAYYTIDISQTFNGLLLNAGDEVFIYTEIEFNTTWKGIFDVRQNSVTINATSLEHTADSPAKGWLVFDVVNQAIKAITNNKSRLRSTFLSTASYLQPADGQGSLYLMTNGKQIRRFNALTNPLLISLKDALNTVKSLFCLGYGFEKNGTTEIVRVERVNYFYRNKQITVIENCAEYREEVAKDLLYNELEFGYDKFQDSGYNTLDEFNTKHEAVTPIKTNKLKLPFKSPAIASGYSIETSRREQYSDTATDSFQNDDDPFIIAVRKSGTQFVPEKNEPYGNIFNLISPGTAYNLRISPIRMLINWAVWLRNIFHYKAGTEVIKTTFVAQNGALITDFHNTEPNYVGDINKQIWREDQDVSMTEYAVEERIYRPEYIFLKARITPDIVQIIDESMRGNWNDQTNYGYITVKDDKGEYQAGFLEEIEYNYASENCRMTLLKKFDSPVDPNAECCDYLVANGCEILINGEKVIA